MERSLLWTTVFCLAAASALVMGGQYLIAAIAGIVWVGAIAMITMRKTAIDRISDPRENMQPESRSLFAPIHRMTNDIEEIVHSKSASPIMKIVGGDAIAEAGRIREQVAKALAVRDELKRTLRERGLADSQIADFKAKADAAASPEEKSSLLSALEAKNLEVEHYAEVDKAIAQIDSGIARANAALAEMKARLSVKASTEKAAALEDSSDALRDAMSRMKDLSVSYDEAEQLLKS
jgi:hypothetical protein